MDAPPITVLLIDDDEGDALLTRAQLGSAAVATGIPYVVQWERTFEDGLLAALKGRHDAALVDYHLRPGSGLDLIRAARAAGVVTPFILLTGSDDPSTDRAAMEAGASDFLSKASVDAPLLERSIRYALQHARALRALASKTRELERSNAELEQFARAVSHDLRQPLHVIASYAELVASRYEGQLDEKALRMISRILAGVDRMNAMIEDLLSLARLDPRGEGVSDVACDEALRAVLAEFQPRVEATNASIEAGPLPVVRGRSGQIRQLLRNLVGNSLKFVSDEAPRIHISCAAESEVWHFVVEDNGIGVPAEHREAIFEPFRRGPDRDRYPGTGVGLALCAKIARQHGGAIWVEPGASRGARFHFTIAR